MFWRRRKPSEILTRSVDGRGRGGEIDDYVHSNLPADEEEKVVKPLMEINVKYASGLVPGIANREAFAEIRQLAERLRKEGL